MMRHFSSPSGEAEKEKTAAHMKKGEVETLKKKKAAHKEKGDVRRCEQKRQLIFRTQFSTPV
jgi:hypothetical protein